MQLTRDDQNSERTYGVLTDGDFTCQALELPWLDDRPDVSCERAGAFALTLGWSPHFGYALYEIDGDTRRSGVRIHSANIPAQLLGCVALGESRQPNKKIPDHDAADGLNESRDALDRFMAHCGVPNYRDLTTAEAVRGFLIAHPEAATFPLTITDPPAGP